MRYETKQEFIATLLERIDNLLSRKATFVQNHKNAITTDVIN